MVDRRAENVHGVTSARSRPVTILPCFVKIYDLTS